MPTSLAPGVGQERRRDVAVVSRLRVGVVVHREDVVVAREGHDLVEEPVGHHRTGRVVRVVEEHHPGAFAVRRRDGAEVRREAPLGYKAHEHRLASRQDRAAGVHGVARVGRQRCVALVEEGDVEVEDRLLGANGRDYLGLRIDLHAEAPPVERRHRLAELRPAAIGRVLVRARVRDGALGGLHDRVVCRSVRIADPQADHVDARRPLRGDLKQDQRKVEVGSRRNASLDRDGEAIELSPEPSWGRVAYVPR